MIDFTADQEVEVDEDCNPPEPPDWADEAGIGPELEAEINGYDPYPERTANDFKDFYWWQQTGDAQYRSVLDNVIAVFPKSKALLNELKDIPHFYDLGSGAGGYARDLLCWLNEEHPTVYQHIKHEFNDKMSLNGTIWICKLKPDVHEEIKETHKVGRAYRMWYPVADVMCEDPWCYAMLSNHENYGVEFGWTDIERYFRPATQSEIEEYNLLLEKRETIKSIIE